MLTFSIYHVNAQNDSGNKEKNSNALGNIVRVKKPENIIIYTKNVEEEGENVIISADEVETDPAKSNHKENRSYTLEFNSDGSLLSAPPITLNPGDVLRFRVYTDKTYWERKVYDIIERYTTSISNLDDTDILMNYFGLNMAQLDNVKNELSQQLFTLKQKLKQAPIDEGHFNRHIEHFFHLIGYTTSGNPQLQYVPAVENLLYPNFHIMTKSLSKNSANFLTEKSIQFKKEQIDYLFSSSFISSEYLIPPDVTKIIFEIREEENLSHQIFDWSLQLENQGIVFPKELIPILSTIRQTIDGEFTKKLKTINKKVEEGADITSNECDWISAEASNVLNLKKRLQEQNINVRNWVLHWLWLTKGVPKINPFDYGIDPSPAGGHLGNVLQETPLFKDQLLYQGELMVSSEIIVYMRHHDGKNEFILMNQNPKKEITEKERMYIMLNNKDPNKQFDIDIDTQPIDSDLSAAEEDVAKFSFRKDVKCLNDLITLNEVVNHFALINTSSVMPLRLLSDNTPRLETINLLQDYEYDAPTEVNYKINLIEKENGSPNNKIEVWTGKYRINKLYRFRFKAGVVYSFLNRDDYTIENGQAILERERQGFDGIFGLQGFILKRQDIRKPGITFSPFLFLGFSISDDPVKNWYLGGGFEIVNGIAVMGGAHFGETEKLVNNNGNLSEKTTFKGAGFVSLAVDLNIFQRIFFPTGLNNPFK